MTDTVLYERQGAVAKITLNRPDAANSISLELAKALMEAAIKADEDEAVRVVLLTGNGKMFCAGGDVGSFGGAGDDLGPLLKNITAYLHMAVSRLARMGKPLIVAVNGPAAGAGMVLAALGDIVIASEKAHFTMAYTAIGYSPDGGSTWLLPRLIGLRRTQELALTNRRVLAEEAVSIGLITRAVPAEELAAEADKMAEQLAAGATYAFGRTRNLLLSTFGAGFEAQMEEEARSLADTARSGQGREGVAAFLGKRKAEFQ